MISVGGLGGWGMQDKDPNLADKIAKLKQSRRSPEDTVRRFLEDEIGVDPDALPFSSVQARDALVELLERVEGDRVHLVGNSMGLRHVRLDIYDAEPVRYDPASPEWHDLERAWTAFTDEFQDIYIFTIERQYPEVEVKPVDAPPVKHTDPTKYPPGSVLQVQKQTMEGDQLVFDRMYIRIGGLFDDTTPTNVDTAQPIHDLTGWLVREELS